MSAIDEVRKASSQFYAALNKMVNGDAGPMKDIWSSQADVTAQHPIGGRDTGSDQVQGSWAGVAGISSDGHVELKDQLLRVTGDLAYELGVEHVEAKFSGQKVGGNLRVTNVYRREGGKWKIVHHHVDEDPEMKKIVSKLQAAAAN